MPRPPSRRIAGFLLAVSLQEAGTVQADESGSGTVTTSSGSQNVTL